MVFLVRILILLPWTIGLIYREAFFTPIQTLIGLSLARIKQIRICCEIIACQLMIELDVKHLLFILSLNHEVSPVPLIMINCVAMISIHTNWYFEQRFVPSIILVIIVGVSGCYIERGGHYQRGLVVVMMLI